MPIHYLSALFVHGSFRILFVSFLGFITQFQFVQWIKKLPDDKINSLLEFHIVPPEITQEAHRLFSKTAEEQGSVSTVQQQVEWFCLKLALE